MKKIIAKISFYINQRTQQISLLKQLKNDVNKLDKFDSQNSQLLISDYLERNLYNNPKYLDNKRLNRFERQVFSQYGEDGILSEIFRRLGINNGFFVEFGVESGIECNTTNLLIKKWKGLWIDGSEKYYNKIREDFSREIESKQLQVLNNFVTPENVENLFIESGVQQDFDLLSIDIDYNDYHVWKSLKKFKPKVVVIEYNSTFDPKTEFIVEYNERGNNGIFTSHFGASLLSFELLAEEMGYSLVGCSYSGVNAFFIRKDLLQNHFHQPYTAENHYEPPRYFLYTKNGHYRSWKNKYN